MQKMKNDWRNISARYETMDFFKYLEEEASVATPQKQRYFLLENATEAEENLFNIIKIVTPLKIRIVVHDCLSSDIIKIIE